MGSQGREAYRDNTISVRKKEVKTMNKERKDRKRVFVSISAHPEYLE